MLGLNRLFQGKKCSRCKEMSRHQGTDLCERCLMEAALETIGYSYNYQSEWPSDKITRNKVDSGEILVEAVGAISSPSAAVKTITSAPDAKRVAWANLDEEGKGQVVVEGVAKSVPSGGLDSRSPIFSSNGKAFGYIIRITNFYSLNEDVLVINKTDDRTENTIIRIPCDFATDLTFSPDGSSFGYIGVKHGPPQKIMVYINNSQYGPFDGMTNKVKKQIVFNKNGTHHGFFAHRGDDTFAIIDGKEFGPYGGFRDVPLFSEAGDRFVYDVKIDGRSCVVDSGKPGNLYDVTTVGPSMDLGGEHVVYGAIQDNKCHVIVDGAIVETFHRDKAVPLPRVSPDGRKIATVLLREDRVDVLVDGNLINTHKRPEQVALETFVWSPDSKRFAYLCGTKQGAYIMVDKEHIGPIDNLEMPGVVFSQDSRHYAAIVKADTHYAIMKDGKIIKHFIKHPGSELAVLPSGLTRFAEVDVLRSRINWIEVS